MEGLLKFHSCSGVALCCAELHAISACGVSRVFEESRNGACLRLRV